MITINKYPVEEEGEFMLQLPRGARILTMEAQMPKENPQPIAQRPVIYMMEDPKAPLEPRRVLLTASRKPIPPGKWIWRGTAMLCLGIVTTHLLEDVSSQEQNLGPEPPFAV